MSKKRAASTLLLTQRAIDDIAGIETYSISQWGRRTASKYVGDLEAGLARIKDHPELLWAHEEFHADLKFYRVNQHLFVCDVQPSAIIVLTVIYASRDIPNRLAELEPSLVAEAALLHKQVRKANKK